MNGKLKQSIKRHSKTDFLLLPVFLSAILFWPSLMARERIRVVSYNVENLFDTKDNPLKDDNEFLPKGEMKWTDYKYWTKLRNITRVITAIGEMEPPAIIGLVEIENDSVLFDLTRRSPLRAQRYEYLCSQSPDARGVNVGMLYQRDKFKVLEKKEYIVQFEDKNTRPTRNILHASGRVISGDTLDVFVCHFPSRRGGQAASEPARISVAKLLKAKTDSLFAIRATANILIMGDFNDLPTDKSLSDVLNAVSVNSSISSKKQLINAFLHRAGERDFGTYKFQGNWDLIDQFVFSSNLLSETSSIQLQKDSPRIFHPDFLQEEDLSYGGVKPFRTNLGPNYLGGFSDHFPIVLDLTVKDE
jgi:predicted extracellular nuclease